MKTTEFHKPDGRYLLVNTNSDFTELLHEWIKSEELESVDLLNREHVEALRDETVDTVLLLFNTYELNTEWVFKQALRLLRVGGKLVVCDIAARDENTIRDDLYKEYMPLHSKSGVPDNLDKEMAKKGMNSLLYEKKRGIITGIFTKER